MKEIIVSIACENSEALFVLRFDASQFPVRHVMDHVTRDVKDSVSFCLEEVSARLRFEKEFEARLALGHSPKLRG